MDKNKKNKTKILRTLMKSVREYKVPAILSPVFVMLETGIECLIPFVTAKLIDNITAKKLDVIFGIAATLFICALLALTFGFFAAKFTAKASAGFAKNLREDVFFNIQEFSFSNIDKFSTSSLVTRLTTDITNIQHSFSMIIRAAFRVPLMMIFSICMAFFVSMDVAWIFIIILPVTAVLLLLIVRIAIPMFSKIFPKYDEFNESIQENISGIRVVKTYVREEFEKEKFKVKNDNIKKEFIRAEKIVAFNGPVLQLGIYTALALVTILGTKTILSSFGGYDPITKEPIWGELSPGTMQSLIGYGFQMLSSLMMLSMIVVMISISLPAMRRVVEVIKEKPTIVNPVNPIYKIQNGEIEFKNVNFKYSEHAEKFALNDIDLKIESGMTVGIIGGTGSSKTTLVNLISRLYDVTEGELLVGGVNVKDYDIKSLRDAVSVVLQKNVLFSGTIRENLLWGDINATDDEIEYACKLACADEFINSFEDKYEHHIEQGGTNVSGGQKQRLCIARALIKKPKVLILDDSTSAVDMKTDAIIREGFKKFLPNTTKIIIAQRLSSIEDADMVVVMNNGHIDAIGTNEELLKTNAIYQEVYNIQNSKGGNE